MLAAIVAQPFENGQQLDGVNVVDVLGAGVPLEPPRGAEGLVVPSDTQAVPDAQGCRPQDVRLDGDAVSIPTGHLHYRLQPLAHDQRGGSDAGQADDRGLVIGDVVSIGQSLEQASLLEHLLAVSVHRGADLHGDRKVPLRQDPFQVASTFHGIASVATAGVPGPQPLTSRRRALGSAKKPTAPSRPPRPRSPSLLAPDDGGRRGEKCTSPAEQESRRADPGCPAVPSAR